VDHAAEPCLSVIVPCFNEVSTVRTVVDRVLASPWTAEVVVVDDGSTDGTRDVLDEMEADPAYGRVRVFRQDPNQGKGAALRRGFAEATARFVVVQDADLEYDPAEYGGLVRPLLDDLADVVYGSRFHSSQPHRVLYFWHSVGNRFLTTLSNMFTNLNLTDMETCFKVFRREVIQSVVIEEDRFGFEPEVTAKVARGGWRVYELGISYRGRTYDEGKKIGWRDGVRAIWCILKYSSVGERVRQVVDPAGRAAVPVPASRSSSAAAGSARSPATPEASTAGSSEHSGSAGSSGATDGGSAANGNGGAGGTGGGDAAQGSRSLRSSA
jgi:glycosyltransferase involved in cell wall biosynthesis